MTKLGKFEIHHLLGRGGMGVVYKAWDPTTQRWVALKTITPDKASRELFIECFKQEAISAARLGGHPNIVTVYESGEQRLIGEDGIGEDVCYLAMEFIPGINLEHLLSTPEWESQYAFHDRLDLLIQVCRGLSHAHSKGVVHRDLKPANIMICSDGGVKIVDFGIARLGESSVRPFTIAGAGTPQYSAPEQLEGLKVDGRADIFAAGVIAYRVYTGHFPFEAESIARTLHKILHVPAPPLNEYLVDYPPELERILSTALAKNRDERYQKVEELALDCQVMLAALNTQLISSYITEARDSLTKRDYPKTRESLSKVFRLEPNNGIALELWQQTPKLESNRKLQDSVGVAIRDGKEPDSSSPLTVVADPKSKPADLTSTPSAVVSDSVTDLLQERFSGNRMPQDIHHAGSRSLMPDSSQSTFDNPLADSSHVEPVSSGVSTSGPSGRKSFFANGAFALIAAAASIFLVTWFAMRYKPSAQPTAAPSSTIRIDVSPWATIQEVRNRNTQQTEHVTGETTPIELSLPPGDYDFVFKHPTLGTMTRPVHLDANGEQSVHWTFDKFDPDAIIGAYRQTQ